MFGYDDFWDAGRQKETLYQIVNLQKQYRSSIAISKIL